MTAAINVNLRHCECTTGTSKEWSECAGHPVLIPCPIPRSVTFEVRLGECIGCERGRTDGQHFSNCPARPVEVSCNISGETWADTEVTSVEVREFLTPPREVTIQRLLEICGSRWALVKALVVGQPREHNGSAWTGAMVPLFAQRDAVYAALADMARAEQNTWNSAQALVDALPTVYISPEMQVRDLEDRASARWLSAYVEHLIEQVGVLP